MAAVVDEIGRLALDVEQNKGEVDEGDKDKKIYEALRTCIKGYIERRRKDAPQIRRPAGTRKPDARAADGHGGSWRQTDHQRATLRSPSNVNVPPVENVNTRPRPVYRQTLVPAVG